MATKKVTVQAYVELGDDKFIPVDDCLNDNDKRQKALDALYNQRVNAHAGLSLINSTIKLLENSGIYTVR